MSHKMTVVLLTAIAGTFVLALALDNPERATPANISGSLAIAFIALALTAGSGFLTGYARLLARQRIFRVWHVGAGGVSLFFSWAYVLFSAYVPAQPIRSLINGEFYALTDSARISILAGAVVFIVAGAVYCLSTMMQVLTRRGIARDRDA